MRKTPIILEQSIHKNLWFCATCYERKREEGKLLWAKKKRKRVQFIQKSDKLICIHDFVWNVELRWNGRESKIEVLNQFKTVGEHLLISLLSFIELKSSSSGSHACIVNVEDFAGYYFQVVIVSFTRRKMKKLYWIKVCLLLIV